MSSFILIKLPLYLLTIYSYLSLLISTSFMLSSQTKLGSQSIRLIFMKIIYYAACSILLKMLHLFSLSKAAVIIQWQCTLFHSHRLKWSAHQPHTTENDKRTREFIVQSGGEEQYLNCISPLFWNASFMHFTVKSHLPKRLYFNSPHFL